MNRTDSPVTFQLKLVPKSIWTKSGTFFTCFSSSWYEYSAVCILSADGYERDAFGFDSLDWWLIHSFIRNQNKKSFFITEFSLDTTWTPTVDPHRLTSETVLQFAVAIMKLISTVSFHFGKQNICRFTPYLRNTCCHSFLLFWLYLVPSLWISALERI
jgi:hypothetical protein